MERIVSYWLTMVPPARARLLPTDGLPVVSL